MSKKKEILHARSKENGIVFYSNKFPDLCYEAYIDEKGEIQTEPKPSIYMELEDYLGMLVPRRNKDREKKETFYLRITLVLLGVLFGIIIKNISVSIAFLYVAIFVAEDFVKFANIVHQTKFGNYKASGKFHSAEHMATKAYEKYGRIPTMLELKKMSRFDKYCGSRKYILKIVYYTLAAVIIAFCNYLPNYVYFGTLAVLMLFLILDMKFNLSRVLQLLVTNKPTDKELEVAIEGLRLFEVFETQLPGDDFCPAGMIFVEIVYEGSEMEEDTESNRECNKE